MAETTKIEWADATFNPWIGCTKVSPACEHCYAEVSTAARATAARLAHPIWGPGALRHRTSESYWQQPKRWDAAASIEGVRRRVFCASLADVFDNEVDPAWRRDLMQLAGRTQHLDWLFLTKRIGNARRMLNEAVQELSHGLNTWDEHPWRDVWLGASVVTQEEAERDIPKLLQTPARRRFLSIEPMLGPIDLTKLNVAPGWQQNALNGYERGHGGVHCDLPRIDWVIVGGESGPSARPIHPDWVRRIREDCRHHGIPFLFKQWGEWLPGEVFSRPHLDPPGAMRGGITRHQDGLEGGHGGKPDHWWSGDAFNGLISTRVGKAQAGRLLDGRTHDEVPR